MSLVDPNSARSAILHALAKRPMMTTNEVVDAVGPVPYVSVSFYIGDCDLCGRASCYRTGRAEITYYTIHTDAYRLLRGLEKNGKVQRAVLGTREVAWSLTPELRRSMTEAAS